jgi:CelD/BcsL family acetyltransferase involved in cellulose biosynthesis
LKLEVIEDLTRFLSISHDWRALGGRCPSATPFQLPEWVYTWWHFFGSGELRVFTGWKHGDLVALLPCFLHSWNNRKQLTIIGSGITDYLGCLVDAEHAASFLSAIQEHLRTLKDWDICDWQDLSEGDMLKCWEPSQYFRVAHVEDTPCTRRSLESSDEEFIQSLSSGLRRNVRRYANRLEQTGRVEYGVACAAQTELIESIFNLHTREWNCRGGPGMVEETGSGPFLRAVAGRFSSEDKFRLFYISLDGEPIACIYALVHNGIAYGYMSGFDPDYAQYSLGTLTVAHAMRTSIGAGVRTWDFLRGDEEYKFSWGAQRVPKWRLLVERT